MCYVLLPYTALAGGLAQFSSSTPIDSCLFTYTSCLLVFFFKTSTIKSSQTVSSVSITKSFLSTYRHKGAMSASGGTYRGTPNRGQNRAQVPTFENSPSNIPRPKLESHASSAMQSECATSTLSASRQKQSKRDEVFCLSSMFGVHR